MARAKRDDHTIKDGRTLPIFIHSTIDDMTDLTPNTMRVYMHLSRRANKEGTAWPSYQSIGDHCFSSVNKHPDVRRRNAVAAIADLIKAGLIKREKRKNEHGQQTNCYTLLDPVTLTSQPEGTSESHLAVTSESQGFGTFTSQPAVISEYLDPVTLTSPKGSPLKDTPLGKNGINSSSDVWAKALAELLPTLSSGLAGKYLFGSRLEAAGHIDGVARYRVVVEPSAAVGVAWLTVQTTAAIRRTLASLLKHDVKIEIAVAEREPVP